MLVSKNSLRFFGNWKYQQDWNQTEIKTSTILSEMGGRISSQWYLGELLRALFWARSMLGTELEAEKCIKSSRDIWTSQSWKVFNVQSSGVGFSRSWFRKIIQRCSRWNMAGEFTIHEGGNTPGNIPNGRLLNVDTCQYPELQWL